MVVLWARRLRRAFCVKAFSLHDTLLLFLLLLAGGVSCPQIVFGYLTGVL